MIPAPTRILLATEHVDFRNSIEGLASRVERELKENPLSGTMFVFRNRSCTALKLLYWSHGGFLLIYKKLEKGRFRLPPTQGIVNPLRPQRWRPSWRGLIFNMRNVYHDGIHNFFLTIPDLFYRVSTWESKLSSLKTNVSVVRWRHW